MPGLDRESEPLEPRLDHLRAANQDGPRHALFGQHLRGAQHALVFSVGIDDAYALSCALGDHRLHDEAGAKDEAVEAVLIGVEVADRSLGDTALDGCTRDGWCDAEDETLVERGGMM